MERKVQKLNPVDNDRRPLYMPGAKVRGRGKVPLVSGTVIDITHTYLIESDVDPGCTTEYLEEDLEPKKTTMLDIWASVVFLVYEKIMGKHGGILRDEDIRQSVYDLLRLYEVEITQDMIGNYGAIQGVIEEARATYKRIIMGEGYDG